MSLLVFCYSEQIAIHFAKLIKFLIITKDCLGFYAQIREFLYFARCYEIKIQLDQRSRCFKSTYIHPDLCASDKKSHDLTIILSFKQLATTI